MSGVWTPPAVQGQAGGCFWVCRSLTGSGSPSGFVFAEERGPMVTLGTRGHTQHWLQAPLGGQGWGPVAASKGRAEGDGELSTPGAQHPPAGEEGAPPFRGEEGETKKPLGAPVGGGGLAESGLTALAHFTKWTCPHFTKTLRNNLRRPLGSHQSVWKS